MLNILRLDKRNNILYNILYNADVAHFLSWRFMKRYYFLCFFSFLFPVILIAADAKKDFAQSDFMRISKPEGKKFPVSFDTAIAKFSDAQKGIQVDLIGAVDIGDKKYYAELNEVFKQYDAVLYELVAEEGGKPNTQTGKNESQSVLSSFQLGMGKALALDFQLAHIDYHAKNMVHADMNPLEFAQRVSDRGDLVQMIYRALILGMKKSGDKEAQEGELKTQGRVLGALLAADPALSLKRVLAEEMMKQLDDGMWLVGGDGSAIITDRNEAALKVLAREIKKGKKKIAIFYGAAHLPEMAKSLKKDFHMKPTGIDWVIAWDMTKDASARE
jgi:DnaJ-domain-containing protein 1